jgi:FixJ family two-component response regulator
MLSNTHRVVHLVDDDASMRAALACLLEAGGYRVMCYASGPELLQNTRKLGGCVLLDLEMPEIDGLALQQALRQRYDRLPIVFMSGYRDVRRAVGAMKGGAKDFLTKPIPPELLLATIEAVLLQAAEEAQDHTPIPPLSERERIVLHRVVNGHINKEIAKELSLSERTIKSCRADLMRKLGAHSFVDLVRTGTLALTGAIPHQA